MWHSLRQGGPDPSLTFHLQPELRRVTQLMMTRDAERRPSVQFLLQLPSLKVAARRRGRQLTLARNLNSFKSFCFCLLPLFHFIISLFSQLVKPLLFLFAPSQVSVSTPPPHKAGPSTTDQCYSDDEPENSVSTVSSTGSELAAPLHDSSSSPKSKLIFREDCFSSFTPPIHRSRVLARTPGRVGNYYQLAF